MKKKYTLILSLAIIAIINATYLSWSAYKMLSGEKTSLGCDINPTFSCSNVIIHPDTMIFGIPFPYLALIVYPVIAALALWGLTSNHHKPAKIIKWIALAGMCFNAYILTMETLFVHAYCILCLICVAIIITIFGVSWTMRK